MYRYNNFFQFLLYDRDIVVYKICIKSTLNVCYSVENYFQKKKVFYDKKVS